MVQPLGEREPLPHTLFTPAAAPTWKGIGQVTAFIHWPPWSSLPETGRRCPVPPPILKYMTCGMGVRYDGKVKGLELKLGFGGPSCRGGCAKGEAWLGGRPCRLLGSSIPFGAGGGFVTESRLKAAAAERADGSGAALCGALKCGGAAAADDVIASAPFESPAPLLLPLLARGAKVA